MTSSPSPSTKNQCFDAVTIAANLVKNDNISSQHVEDENEEDEEGDMDFNPFLKEAPSLEASSSLSSEIEEFEFDADVVDSRKNHSHVVNDGNAPDELQNVEPNIDMNTVTDTVTDDVNADDYGEDDEDAIWRRTRARYSLVGSTLDELETFLQETDDEDDLRHNVDDEEEYRKFLMAVLTNDASSTVAEENENEDEDNDADFELELEEALESDGDENLHNVSRERERRPETRQKKRQKTRVRQNEFSGHVNRPLRPILPYTPIVPNTYTSMTQNTSFVNNDYVCAFTPPQIGQLHCLIYEHVQLLVQLFSLSVLEPSRQHIATQAHKFLIEMVQIRDQVVSSGRVPHPSFCFSIPYICSNTVSTDGSFWVPFVSDNVQSVVNVAPLNLVQSYMDDIAKAAQEHQQRRLEVGYDGGVDRECLFPFNGFLSSDGELADKGSEKTKKTIAGALVERSRSQSIALVPKDVAKLALRFFPLFNPALFPHKPPPLSVANRVLFTDAEDGLLARGLMRYNNDWEEIQKNFLPCKTPHQIFVRQKNRACSRAPENPIKAVRRMKTSPLTLQEKALIEEGLKIYKLDWMAVWRYMVPHRDPSMLPRQWRTAIGNQKSYKGDEHSKARRRMYESQRRKSKQQITGVGQSSQGWSNEDEAGPLPGFPTHCGTDNGGGENNSGDDVGNNEDEAYVHEAFLSDYMGENPQVELFAQNRSTNDPRNVNNSLLSHRVPATFLRPEVNMRSYRARKADCSRLVKLAPGLPPVNLPPTVRVMSQSAFSKYQDEARSQSQSEQSQQCSIRDNNADLQLHPLLFQDHEDGNLPYYPLNGSASTSSSFELNLNLFRYSKQSKHTVNFFNNSLKSKELTSSLTGVDFVFHPLMQRSDDGNGNGQSSSEPTGVDVVPRGANEVDLDIRLSSVARNENESRGLAEDGNGSVGVGHDEIVMEQEELSDSEDDDVAESVEFECEEMTDSEGEGGSDSDRGEHMQNEDVLGEDSDQEEPRLQETADSNEKNEPKSLLGLNLNPKPPVTRSCHASRSSRKTTLPHQQMDAASQVKKPRKRAQNPDPR